MAHPDRERCIEAIRQHIATYGEEQLSVVASQFPQVATATFYRWVQSVRTGIGTPPSAKEKAVARDTLATWSGKGKQPAHPAAKHLPAMPNPAYVANNPVRAGRKMDLLADLLRLEEDAELLRECALESNGAILCTKIFTDSIRIREGILNTRLKVTEQIFEIRQFQAFMDAVLTEIGTESPEVARRIVARLDKFNELWGSALEVRV